MDEMDQRPRGGQNNVPAGGNDSSPPGGGLLPREAGTPAWQQLGKPFASHIAGKASSFASRVDRRIRPSLSIRQHPWRPIWKPDDIGFRSSNWAERLVLPIHTVVASLMSRLERTLSSSEESVAFAWAAPLRGLLSNILARSDDKLTDYAPQMDQPEVYSEHREDWGRLPHTEASDEMETPHARLLPDEPEESLWKESGETADADTSFGPTADNKAARQADYVPDGPGLVPDLTHDMTEDAAASFPQGEGPAPLTEAAPSTTAASGGPEPDAPTPRSPSITHHVLPGQSPRLSGTAASFSAAVQRRVQPPKSVSPEAGDTLSSTPRAVEPPGSAFPQKADTAPSAETAAVPDPRPIPISRDSLVSEPTKGSERPSYEEPAQKVPAQPDPAIATPPAPFIRPETVGDKDAVTKSLSPAPAEEIKEQLHKAMTAEETAISMPVVKHARPSAADNLPEHSPALQPTKSNMEEVPVSLSRPTEPARNEYPVPPAAESYGSDEGQNIGSTPPLDTGRRQTTAAGSTIHRVPSPPIIFPYLPIMTRAKPGIQSRSQPGPEEDGTDVESEMPASFAIIEENFEDRFNMLPEDHPAYESPSWAQKSTAAFLDRIMSTRAEEAAREYEVGDRYIDESDGWTSEELPAAVPAFIPDAVAGAARRPAPQEALTLAVAGAASRTPSTGAPGIAMAPLDRPAADSATVIQRAADTSAPAQTSDAGPAEVDIDALARDVYQIIKRRLVLEKERRAFGN